MSPRRRRILTSDEQALWAHVTQQISPMATRAKARRQRAAAELDESVPLETPVSKAASVKSEPPAPVPPVKTPGKFQKPAWKRAAGAPAVKQATPAHPAFPAGPASAPPAPPLAPLERRLRQRLARGKNPIDAVIDLHGLRQDEAHVALRGFLHAAQRQGHTVVLVVTGKGGAASSGRGSSLFEERGVLRRTVPHWLRFPDLRSVVVGFEEAVQHHGGDGALYVRIRRARTADTNRD